MITLVWTIILNYDTVHGSMNNKIRPRTTAHSYQQKPLIAIVGNPHLITLRLLFSTHHEGTVTHSCSLFDYSPPIACKYQSHSL